MKNYLSMVLAFAAGLFILSSCEGGVDVDNHDKDFEAIAEVFLNNTVYPTYSALADDSEKLVADLEAVINDKSDANIKKACSTFLSARAQWELSEAFLFGAATDFGIDPHIDSWPLDVDGFNDLMSSPAILSKLEGEDGSAYAGAKLGNELLGFHGIEYVLFENGAAKPASKITKEELVYAVAVAGDLRDRTAQLDAAWRGEASGNRLSMVEDDLELNTTVAGGDLYYGENLLSAGKAGSTFRSWTHAMQAILQAAADIADEVGTSKIGKAHTGEDVSYIESPYSYNSITDFIDNITSVENVYYGGVKGNRDESKSLHAWFSKNDPDVDAAISGAISNALAKISSMKAPFVNNISDASCDAAMSACASLVETLENAIQFVANN
ncbi:MAG: peptidase M75 [Bacteroidales bacterium]|nr:peptidase M75 [Bacteroidales bacterium]